MRKRESLLPRLAQSVAARQEQRVLALLQDEDIEEGMRL